MDDNVSDPRPNSLTGVRTAPLREDECEDAATTSIATHIEPSIPHREQGPFVALRLAHATSDLRDEGRLNTKLANWMAGAFEELRTAITPAVAS